MSFQKACILYSVFAFLLMASAITGGAYFVQMDKYYYVRTMIFGLAFCIMTIFLYISGGIQNRFSYDDKEHPERFFKIYLIGIICAFVFVRLPVLGWMFLFFYIALSVVSDQTTGIVSATCLLVMTAMLRDISFTTFLVFFVSGIIGSVLISGIGKEFKIGIPVTLSLAFQLLLMFAGDVLIQNKKIGWEDAVIPVSNTILNCIVIWLFLQNYSSKVAHKEDNIYQMITDPEYDAMLLLKDKKNDLYKRSLHSAFLVERICTPLELDNRAAKCAAYYQHLDTEQLENYPIPVHAKELILQLKSGPRKMVEKEAIIVYICDITIKTILYITQQAKEKEVNYERVIDTLFEKQFPTLLFIHTDISFRDIQFIKQKLLEEKMYYDFLR